MSLKSALPCKYLYLYILDKHLLIVTRYCVVLCIAMYYVYVGKCSCTRHEGLFIVVCNIYMHLFHFCRGAIAMTFSCKLY
ncbi:hypothetical protein GDO81_003390 [Engystomops pustulosus]|uniref:Uncharacterized protein n=1 Tax=Engystomops pustulosus TaxID=76066 RepID=A0AAV6ZZF0_ENGPU|nr:hypothetical protein GDO81_003390 [Engystomops pustulosus]